MTQAQRIVLVHGRAQENKDSIALKGEWLDAMRLGLSKNNLALPMAETEIKFPYYGQTLFDLVSNAAAVAEVVVRGTESATRDEQRFQQAVLEEVQRELGISDAQVDAALPGDVRQRGPANWEWVQGILAVIDQVPGLSAASIALVTRDVYQYLKNPTVRKRIDDGVLQAMVPGVPTVVVAHSLGTVVAYNLLKREGAARGWVVPLFVTLGSPLGVTAIRQAMSPIEHPSCVGAWFNAMDPRDVVALYPLDRNRFDVEPPILNKTDVRNETDNRHGIGGYLDDAEVTQRIHAAVA